MDGTSAARTGVQETMRLALFQPDIPQNLGAFIRLSAGLGVPLDIIEPCGFPVDDKRIRRAAMDYYDLVPRPASRLVLLSTAGTTLFPNVAFQAGDTLLLGRESAGVPAEVHEAADLSVRIPLRHGARSLNVALAAAMVLSEGLRQTQGFSEPS